MKTSFAVSKDERAAIQKIAEEEGITLSAAVRLAVRNESKRRDQWEGKSLEEEGRRSSAIKELIMDSFNYGAHTTSEIMAITGCSRCMALRYLNELHQQGLIKRSRRRFGIQLIWSKE